MNLKNYGLSISGPDLYIDGDEIDVRNFFLHYFMEKNDCGLLEKYPYFQETCFILFKDLTKKDIFSEFKPLFNYFQWKTFVSFIRISKGFMVDVAEEIPKAIIDHTEIAFTDSIKFDLIKMFNLKGFCSRVFTDYIFYLLPSNNTPKQFISETLVSIRSSYEEFLDIFEIKLSDDLINKNCQIFFQFYLGYKEHRFFLFDTEEYKFLLMANDYPKSMKVLFELAEKTLHELGVNSLSAIYNFTTLAINYTPDVLEAFMNYEDKIDVKLFLVTEPSKIEYVEKLLTYRFQNVANFDIVDSDILLKEENVENGLWITNIENVIDKHVLHITVELIHSELSMIEGFINSYLNKTLAAIA